MIMEFTTNYKSDKYYAGAIRSSNNCGDYKVLGKSSKVISGRNTYGIEFLDTGMIKSVTTCQMNSGEVSDPLKKTVYGIGFMGDGDYKTSDKGKSLKEGTMWFNIMQRCYDPKYHETCPSYITTTICSRWENYQNFCEDLPLIEGYDLWKQDSFRYHLDKDKKQIDVDNKVYSLETCCFITNSENTILSNVSTSSYQAIDPTGKKYFFTNQREFAELHDMTRKGISSVISGAQKSHRGWRFYKL